MKAEILKKIIRRKAIWAEIREKEQEYERLQIRIDFFEREKKEISFLVQKLLQEGQDISEWLDNESLKNG